MIGDRERPALAELDTVWFGEGPELAARMADLAGYLDASADGLLRVNAEAAKAYELAASLIREVLTRGWRPSAGGRP